MILTLVIASALAAGYLLGRLRPVRRAFDWANWSSYGRPQARAVVWLLLSAENIGIILTHPRECWHAWKHRHDPPPGRSPAPKFDSAWVANRTTDSGEDPTV